MDDAADNSTHPIARDQVMAAIYRCRRQVRSLYLPDQQQAELSVANGLDQRLYGVDADHTQIECTPAERGFIAYWHAPPSNRLNGTQQLALNYYREGRYQGARQCSEIMGADGGLPWALIQHLPATGDPEVAHRAISKTFQRLCDLSHQMRREFNADIAPEAAPAQDETSEQPAARRTAAQSMAQ